MPIKMHDPTSTITVKMPNVGRSRNTRQQHQQQQPKRIPALTTSRTFGEKSPIVDADLQSFLAKCMSTYQWTRYTEEEQATIISSLPATRLPKRDNSTPQDSRSNTKRTRGVERDEQAHANSGQQEGQDCTPYSVPPLQPAFCSDDQYLKRSIARFKRELSDGYYTKVWQDKAKRAHDERMEGIFDDYLDEHAEEIFLEGVKGEGDKLDELAYRSEDGEYRESSGRNTKVKRNI